MAKDGTWYEVFDTEPAQYEFVWTEDCLELIDEHQHMWEMVAPGYLHCWACGAERKAPRTRARLSVERRKPNER